MEIEIRNKYYKVQDEPEYEGLAVIDNETKRFKLIKKLSKEKPFLTNRQYVVVKIYAIDPRSHGLRPQENEQGE